MLEVLHEVSPPPPRWNSVSHHCIICSRQSLLGPAESFHVHIHLSSWPRNHGESPCKLLGPPFSQLPTFKNAALPISAASIAQDSKFSINETTLYGFHFLAPPPKRCLSAEKPGQLWDSHGASLMYFPSLKDHSCVLPITQCLKRFVACSFRGFSPVGEKVRYLLLSHG